VDINKIKMLKLARRNLIRYRCKINWMVFAPYGISPVPKDETYEYNYT